MSISVTWKRLGVGVLLAGLLGLALRDWTPSPVQAGPFGWGEDTYSPPGRLMPSSPLIFSTAGARTNDKEAVIQELRQLVKEQEQRFKKLEKTMQAEDTRWPLGDDFSLPAPCPHHPSLWEVLYGPLFTKDASRFHEGPPEIGFTY